MKTSIKLLAIIAASTLMVNVSTAAKRQFPRGCKQMNFHFNANQLELTNQPDGQKQTLYLVHNISHYDIKLMVANPIKYAPTHEKVIKYGRWAALAKDDEILHLACYEASQDTMGYSLNCHDVVELCNYNRAKFPPQNIGTYWLDRTGTQRQTVRNSIKKGILLRW